MKGWIVRLFGQRLAQGQVIVDLQGDRLLVIFVSRALQLKPNSFCAAA